jgi:hypothetical protein
MSVQDSAEASQKFTCPGDTPTVPAFTVAASSTSVPDDTDPSDTTVLAAEKIVSAVVVAVDAQAEGKHPPTTIKNSAETRTRQETFAFKRFSNFVLLKIWRFAIQTSNSANVITAKLPQVSCRGLAGSPHVLPRPYRRALRSVSAGRIFLVTCLSGPVHLISACRNPRDD